MAKVLFIYPNLNAQEGFNHGIAALSGQLRAAGHETELIHLNDSLYGPVELEEVARRVMDFDPHLICFSAMSQQYKYALKLARALKDRYPYPIALGGVHATMVPEEVAGDDIFDYIGVGECDLALPALVRALENDWPLSNIPNIWARTGSGYVRNPVGPFPDINALAPKDYDIFDLNHMIPRMNGWVSVITSRGCPHRCTYCFNHQMMHRYKEEAGEKPAAYLRRYAVARIMDELTRLKENHPDLRVFIFDDDLFTLQESYVLEFCEAYASSGLDLPFVVNGHVQAFNERMAKALKAAGCSILKFGVESGSERVRREVLRRSMSDAAIYKAFEAAHAAGLHTSAFIMIGLPLEERVDLQATIQMLARLEPGRFRWAVFYPFPGTDIYDLCQRKGLIDQRKMEDLDNFYEASPLRLDPAHDLFIRKLQRALHWFVNKETSFDSAPLYLERAAEIEGLTEEEWSERAGDFLKEDREISDRLIEERKLHYSIRFTQVMAVRSDFKEKGDDLARPAKEWRSTPAKSL